MFGSMGKSGLIVLPGCLDFTMLELIFLKNKCNYIAKLFKCYKLKNQPTFIFKSAFKNNFLDSILKFLNVPQKLNEARKGLNITYMFIITYIPLYLYRYIHLYSYLSRCHPKNKNCLKNASNLFFSIYTQQSYNLHLYIIEKVIELHFSEIATKKDQFFVFTSF